MIVFVKLTKARSRVLSTISADIGQVFFAAFVGAIALPIDSDKVLIVILYLLLSGLFWSFAVIFGEKGKI